MVVSSAIGIIIGFILLTIGAWKKVNLIFLTLIVSAVIAVTGGLNFLDVWTGPYIDGFVGFAGSYLLLFCFGALFGKIMEDSGASWRLANIISTKIGDKWALAAYVAIATVLIYGGVSIFVVVFLLLPIGKDLFNRLRIPWSIFPAISLISAVSAVALPGSLQILNIIPTEFLGTTPMAGLGIGIFGAVVYYLVNIIYYKLVLRKKEDMFDPEEFKFASTKEIDEFEMEKKAPSLIVSVIPILVALVSINIFKINIILGFLLACLAGFVLFWKSLSADALKTLDNGLNNGIMPLISVSVVVGIAKTVAAVPFFEVLKTGLMSLPFSGLSKAVIITNVVAFFTGSASGSMSMILDIFGQDFLSWGVNAEVLHRTLTFASQGLDSMPWCSVVVMFLSLTGISYSRGYKHIFLTTVIAPTVTAVAMILVSPLFS